MIITIDGPAGSGKSSAARALAARLGFEFLDTGAMYRAVALAALRAGVPFEEGPLQSLLAGLRLEMPPGGAVLLQGEDVAGQIRTAEVTSASSQLAVVEAVRQTLADLQRSIAAGRNMVCEGRDQGTVVFPDAVCKFFLTADSQERARRRQAELEARGVVVGLPELEAEMILRDDRDANRDLAPLRPAADAVLIDTTHLTLEQVVDSLEEEVRRRMKDGSDA
jgi:cytidylate kinase